MDNFDKELQKLIMKAIELNRDDFHTFVDYSGHVEKFEIRVCYGGWTEGQGGESIIYFYTRTGARDVKKVRKAFATLIAASEENEARGIEARKERETRELEQLKKLQKKYWGA